MLLVPPSPSCRVHTSDSHALQSCAATVRMEKTLTEIAMRDRDSDEGPVPLAVKPGSHSIAADARADHV